MANVIAQFANCAMNRVAVAQPTALITLCFSDTEPLTALARDKGGRPGTD